MEKIVFACKDVKGLKKVLEPQTRNDPNVPYNPEDEMFIRLGYTLRDGAAYGTEGYVVYFKAPEEEASKYRDKLKAIEGCEELKGEAKEKVISGIESEEDSASAGFGAVFG
ncbi:hypothetical protein HZC09_02640 [Candidatus Micrarchaeota archaeon]|nr:hypothetical protein [Candidatus Micrarchaeota archaeon]